MRRVVVTGSECTGKTTLACALAAHYSTVWSPEFVREYVEAKGTAPTADDIDAIAHGQRAAEDAAAENASELLILDTDLLSTILYSHHYYGGCSAWIEAAFELRAADLYLLAGIDVPWSPDGGQRDRGDRRDEMQALFRDGLEARGLPYLELSGPHADRMTEATTAIDTLLRDARPGPSQHP